MASGGRKLIQANECGSGSQNNCYICYTLFVGTNDPS
jgi:hypothetical protein